MEKHLTARRNSACKKCSQEKASVVLRTKDPYCQGCFLKYATHKFRATLGKSKLVRPKDRILLATSGSQSSVALLHMVSEGLSEQNNKRFLFTSLAVHIDEGAVTGLSRDERVEALKAVAKQAEDLNFPFYTVQLSNSLNLNPTSILDVNAKVEDIDLNENRIVAGDEQLTSLFCKTRTLTSKEDLLGKLRQNLLMAVAKELGCNKILLGDNGSQLAVKLIANVSIGRGAHLPWDIGFCDVRDSGVMILRPLKEFMGKEIAFYCVFNKLSAVPLPSLSTKTFRMASIRRLTEDFLFGLHADFPSTFSAVIKTGDKLALPTEGSARCVLCKVALDQQNRECSSQQATQFSKELVGKISSKDEVWSNDCVLESDDPSGSDSRSQGDIIGGSMSSKAGCSKLKDCLCYGCCLIVADMDDGGALLNGILSIDEKCSEAAITAIPLSSNLPCGQEKS
ncbi:cytoplasmic tRNA 2-thiolation protein 2 isoform X2 [Hetaerina americana]|uniref:cytoplasmic tRNA 2-thiolation protein 2 isoform X2 n=1 Tax=Hetaerina americana TaxID=62018 RepID=UPI003A7F533A